MAEALHPEARARSLPRFGPPSPPVAYAIRFAVAVSAALWLGNLPGLVTNNPTWILITVLMILQPTTGGFLLKGVLRAVGTLAGAVTAILLFGAFAQDPPFLMVAFFLVQAVAAYGFSGPRFQYAWFVWAFTTAIVLGGAAAGQGAVETVAFQRASMVGLGVLVVAAVDSLFWPARAEPQLRASLAARAKALAG
ncbi:MAG: FUSC family protein, partial [Deltaproteobacteria bacterium]|nr:FUSC family protein [Deltaproteobacteria bacterium]